MFLKSDLINKIFLLLIIAVIFVLHILTCRYWHEIPLLDGLGANLRVNVEGEEQKVLINGKEAYPDLNFPFTSYKTYVLDNARVNNLEINGKNAVVSLSGKFFYLENPDGKFPYKYKEGGKYINDKGFFKIFQHYFLLLFYDTKIFLLGFLVCAFFFLKSPPKNLIWGILLLACCLRLADLNCGLWTDEYYSVYMAGNSNLPFFTVFNDPGNPPLFFILLWILEKISGIHYDILRLLPLLFSILSLYAMHYAVNKYVNYKTSLFCSFIFAINIYSIVTAQELRAYSLLVLLTLLIFIKLFDLINNEDKKDFIIYGILGALLLNTHYFGAIVLFSNFIYGIIFVKDKLKFLFANLCAGLTFLPYFVMTGLNKGLLDNNFNGNIKMPDLNFYIDTFVKFSQGMLPALLIILFSIILICKKKRIYSYSIYMIFSVFLISYFVCFIKSIAQSYYFICLLPFFIILMSGVFLIENKKVKILLFLVLMLSYFNCKDYIKRQRSFFLNSGNIVSYYLADAKNKSEAGIILPYSKDVMKLAYNLSDNVEIMELPYPYTVYDAFNVIEKMKSKRIYFKLEHNVAYQFLKEASLKYDVSFIRCDRDVIIARIIKE